MRSIVTLLLLGLVSLGTGQVSFWSSLLGAEDTEDPGLCVSLTRYMAILARDNTYNCQPLPEGVDGKKHFVTGDAVVKTIFTLRSNTGVLSPRSGGNIQ